MNVMLLHFYMFHFPADVDYVLCLSTIATRKVIYARHLFIGYFNILWLLRLTLNLILFMQTNLLQNRLRDSCFPLISQFPKQWLVFLCWSCSNNRNEVEPDRVKNAVVFPQNTCSWVKKTTKLLWPILSNTLILWAFYGHLGNNDLRKVLNRHLSQSFFIIYWSIKCKNDFNIILWTLIQKCNNN